MMMIDTTKPVFARCNVGPPIAGHKRSFLVKQIISQSGKWCKIQFYSEPSDENGTVPQYGSYTDGTVLIDLLSNVWLPEPVCVRCGC